MPQDMRKHPRFRVENTVFVELASPEFGSSESGSIARCKTVDVSRGGLRVNLDRAVQVSAILQVGVELPAGSGTLYLVADVRWCQPFPTSDAGPGWSAGLCLLNADGSDIDNWAALITTMESV
jgi:hypothetical protein